MKGSKISAFLSAMAVASLGGLIGLGGAEFRLPILVGLFGFTTLIAVIINKVISLAVVIFSLFFRSSVIGFDELLPYFGVIVCRRWRVHHSDSYFALRDRCKKSLLF